MNTYSTNLFLAFKGELDIKLERDAIYVHYVPNTDNVLFDICDMQGKIVRTGSIESEKTRVETSDLRRGTYLMWVVDGGEVTKAHFKLTNQE